MSYTPMEKLLKNTQDSLYKLVILASRRALELGQGSGKLIDDMAPNAKLTSVALQEIKENKISFRVKKKQ